MSFISKIKFVAIVFFTFIVNLTYAQDLKKSLTEETIKELYARANKKGESRWDLTVQRSKSSDAYQLMVLRRDFGTISEMTSRSKDAYWINKGVTLIDNIINTAQISKLIEGNQTHKDNYKGWISLIKDREYHKEVPLYESYSFFYITQFLYTLKKIGWTEKSETNNVWWNNSLKFIEENIWNKWLERSYKLKGKNYWYFLRQRTHMGSHWAGIAMYLGAITSNSEIKKQTAEVQQQYDLLLKRNMKTVNNAYVWNSTYDDVSGTDASGTKKSVIQDVSHGNHVVAYIIAAHEFGDKNWSKTDIDKIANTFKKNVFNKKNHSFNDLIDGTSDKNRPGWGNFVGDGWVKLSSYDTEVLSILHEFSKNETLLKKYYQEIQLKSILSRDN